MDLPIRVASPLPSSSTDGTLQSGDRSETVDWVLWIRGRRADGSRGGDDEGIAVEDVGTGVGYLDGE